MDRYRRVRPDGLYDIYYDVEQCADCGEWCYTQKIRANYIPQGAKPIAAKLSPIYFIDEQNKLTCAPCASECTTVLCDD